MADYRKLADNLKGLIEQRRTEKVNEETERRRRNDEDRNKILENIGQDVAKSLAKELAGFMKELADGTKLSAEELRNVFDGMQIAIPPIKIPEPKVTVNVPPIKLPDNINKLQNQPFPERFKIDDTNPIPVILTDTKGERYGISQFVGGGGGKINKQYQERDIASLITGLAVMMEGAGDELFPLQAGPGVSDRALRVVHATDVATSVNLSLSSALDVLQVSGSADSVNIIQSISLETRQVSGSVNSSEVHGLARQTNPAAVADGAEVRASFDDLGRQVITPYQVRDLVTTAYLVLANGTETALLAGAASTLHDLMYVMCANTSDGVVDIDFRSGTAGAVIMSVTIPADSTAGVAPPMPIPQTEAAQAWTADMGDFSGTTVNISALFIKNV